ncbi:MAG: hypothetical protein J7J80_00875 [Thermotogae bacterium]|nr:hypothetical protein [Thermotogota bacterium]
MPLVKKLSSELYLRYKERLYSREDLEQTVWYLAILAAKDFDPKRGSLGGYIRSYVMWKIVAHMNGESLPKVAGSPFSLHRDLLLDTDRMQIPCYTNTKAVVLDMVNDPVVDLLRKGYKPREVCKKANLTRKQLREHLSKYRER